MIKQTDLSGKLAFDAKGLGDLQRAAHGNSPEALRGAATQFEAMFVNMMLKSMRDATPQDGMFDSQETKTFTTMLDQQLSQTMAKRGVGLADVLVRQLSASQQALAVSNDTPAANPGTPFAPHRISDSAKRAETKLEPLAASGGGAKSKAPHIQAFQDKLAAHAEEAARVTGVPAKFMLGQAALESGWGRHEIRNADGSASHNLFGIKAGKDWKGKVTTAVTTEYVHGVPHTRVERFRAYDSYADSFKDYARLLASNPRYQQVLAHGGDAASFAHGLQKAGYATDPFYATKLTRIIKQHLIG
ncbi:MAG TPA: flagellar assembly peptidoglycan hydrolase FlgJ [Telluria sp.]|nr:flagellar assembly peptidoglycan hydrolase FlgJ [Telluria sp.]